VRRVPLLAKVLGVAFLNLAVLALLLALLARLQFRLDAGSFLLAPAQNRILAAAHALSLELDERPGPEWAGALAEFGRTHGVSATLLDEEGHRVAGADWAPPAEVVERVPSRHRPQAPPPPQREPHPLRPREERAPAPPLFLISAGEPAHYWAGVRIPLRQDRQEAPKPGTLVLSAPSLFASPLLFDPQPWLAAGGAVLLISTLCWLPLIRGVTRSLSQLTRSAGQIAEGQFEVQVPSGRRDEIGQLGRAVQRMASRLSGYVAGQKRFLGGIAHELCTPLATTQFALGNLERELAPEQRARLADVQEEVEHMSALVNELLQFSRAGMPGALPPLVAVALEPLVQRAIQREIPATQEILADVSPALFVRADEGTLFHAISNLLRNAVRYAGHAGPVSVTAREGSGRVFVTVADHGPGVPEAALDEIFKPFYRLDDSRDQATGGVGLGLALVRSGVEACGGVVRCRNRRPTGLEVELELQASGPV